MIRVPGRQRSNPVPCPRSKDADAVRSSTASASCLLKLQPHPADYTRKKFEKFVSVIDEENNATVPFSQCFLYIIFSNKFNRIAMNIE